MNNNAAQTQCPICGNLLAGPKQCQKEGQNFGKWFKNCPQGCKGKGSFVWVSGGGGGISAPSVPSTSMQGSNGGPQGYPNNQYGNTTQTGQTYSNQQPGPNQYNNNFPTQAQTQPQQQTRQVFMPSNPPNDIKILQTNPQQYNTVPQQNDDRLRDTQIITNKLDQIINLLTTMKNDNFNILNHLNTISQSAMAYSTSDEFKNLLIMTTMKKAEEPDEQETMLN
jgi:hypothetical protein